MNKLIILLIFLLVHVGFDWARGGARGEVGKTLDRG
uniref:Uncharacterized protein n=1 Tax=Chionoecetes opilio bacilliform virus TaxID=1825681 RepID=A0A1Q3DLE2_9VIRU|nr:hypothetical protein SCV_079 [Chionoecetes opilio bacilliform virus]